MVYKKLLSLIFYCMAFINAEKIPQKAFYFVRHGKTEWNELGKQQGQMDIPLNDAGRKQVEKLRTLSDTLPFTHFYSSTLSRAHETMKILNTVRNLPETVFDDLKEQGKGVLEGITEQEWKTTDRAIIEAAMENSTLFQQRTENVLYKILSCPGTPCIISHSNNLRCIGKLLDCSITTIPHDTIWYFEPQPDTSWKMTTFRLPLNS